MKIGQQIKFIVINKKAASLHSLIADGKYRTTSLGRNTWKKLIGSQASLQTGCNKEGFNAASSGSYAKARIGILGNDQRDCHTCDSKIGFGTGGDKDDSNTCGNNAVKGYTSDNGERNIKAMGYILVQKAELNLLLPLLYTKKNDAIKGFLNICALLLQYEWSFSLRK